MVRTRIAPSPTGFAHVGTAYAALFNFAFARQNKGKFILRIEDTDVKRQVSKAEEAIYEALRWLGLQHDEGPDIGGPYGPYRQSERLKIYHEHAQKLIKKQMAYEDEGAVRFKVPSGKTSWEDLIRGKIIWENKEIKDFVILKSNGYPTYNFAVVIDDILMKISHVIRAEEHVSNTPCQLLIYQSLGIKLPEFAHLPLLRNPDRSKISKRRSPVAVNWYQEQGYLPEALLNFLCLLGWSHPEEKEIFDIEEFIDKFNLGDISPVGPIFDLKKLNWMNGVYIRKKSDKELLQLLRPFAPEAMSADAVGQTIPLVKERMSKLSDYSGLVDFLVKEPKTDRQLLIEKGGGNKKLIKEQFQMALEKLRQLKHWQASELEKIYRDLAAANSWHVGKFFMATRIALTGKTATPPLFESMELLGKEESLKRLKKIAIIL